MKKFSLKSSLIISALLLSPASVLAQVGTPDNRVNTQAERKALIEQKIESSKRERIIQQCEDLQQKISNIKQRTSTLKDKRGNLVSNIIARLNQFVERIEAANLDATELKDDITKLEALAAESGELWDAYDKALTDLASAKCASDAESQSFHEALQTVRFARTDVQAKMAELRQFFTTEIKADLKNIRQQFKSTDNNNDDTPDDTVNQTNDTPTGQ